MAKALETGNGLFGESQHSAGINKYCQIVWNGKLTDRTFLSFFEPEVYDRLIAVTYVSSPRFFFRVTDGFKHVTLVLGIPDGNVAKQFDFLNPTAPLTFWNELSDSQRGRVRDGSIEVRYAPKGHAIHSKIYTLSGPVGRRVMMGSANLTQHAIQGAQFEEVLVWDTPSACDVYEQRVQQILQETVDYIPEEAKRRVSAIDLTNVSPEVLSRVLEEALSRDKIGLIIPSNCVQEIKERVQQIEIEQEQVVLLKNIVEAVAVPISGGKQLLSMAGLTKNSEHVRKLFVKAKKTDKFSIPDVLPNLTVGSDMRLFRDGNLEEPYARSLLEGPQIAGYLEHIGRFVDAYRQFTVQDSALLTNQRRIYEAILYSFFSPYLWKVREDVERERLGMRGDIPPFLLLAGKAWSGKTHLLRFISILLGGDGDFYHYESLSPSGIRALIDQSGNPTPSVFPVLIDEVDKEYFSGTGNRGEGMLKYLADQLTATHPCLIGTTNNSFRANSQIVRRMYYLEVTTAYLEESRSQSERFFREVIDGLDAGLFKDFTLRVQDKMRDVTSYYDGHDFLAPARAVFREYYKLAGQEIPAWFPGRDFAGLLRTRTPDLERPVPHAQAVLPSSRRSHQGRPPRPVRRRIREIFQSQVAAPAGPPGGAGIFVLRREEFFKFLRLKPSKFFELFGEK